MFVKRTRFVLPKHVLIEYIDGVTKRIRKAKAIDDTFDKDFKIHGFTTLPDALTQRNSKCLFKIRIGIHGYANAIVKTPNGYKVIGHNNRELDTT